MDLSKRLVLLKSSAKEEDYPAYTPEDVLFLFEEITQPEGVILNHSEPSLHQYTPMDEIYNLNKDPSWVGASMSLTIRQPPSSILNM